MFLTEKYFISDGKPMFEFNQEKILEIFFNGKNISSHMLLQSVTKTIIRDTSKYNKQTPTTVVYLPSKYLGLFRSCKLSTISLFVMTEFC